MLGRGLVEMTGVITPEEAFKPELVFAELAKRQLLIHRRVDEL
jgi:hypothetical protein